MIHDKTFIETIKSQWFIEFSAPVGPQRKPKKWEVCDLAGNVHASSYNEDEAIAAALSKFKRLHGEWWMYNTTNNINDEQLFMDNVINVVLYFMRAWEPR